MTGLRSGRSTKQLSEVPCSLLVSGLLLVACGSGLSQENFPEAYGEALCHWQKRCGEIRDEDACVSSARELAREQREAGLQAFPYYGGALREHRVLFDEDAAQACVHHIRDSACTEDILHARSSDVCQIIKGQRGDNEACLSTPECGRESYCELPEGPLCIEGKCVHRLELGQTVTDFRQQCAPGLVRVNNTCQAAPGENGACRAGVMCTPGLYCSDEPGVCRRPAAEGEPCEDAGMPLCLSHLRCQDGHCQRLADVGMACSLSPFSSVGGTYSGCKQDLFCEGDASTGMGTCRERPGLGEPCLGNLCQGLLFCDSSREQGTCQPAGKPGESCARVPCGPGSYCDQDTSLCVRQGRLGEPCDSSQYSPCIESLLCMNGTCEPDFGGVCGS